MILDKNLFTGELVRLAAMNPGADAEAFARWQADSEYMRLQDSDSFMPATPKQMQRKLEKELEREPATNFEFSIRTLSDDKPIGSIGLGGVRWNHSDVFVGIGLGDRDYWGNGYGTDAMRVILRYAFMELNLHRVSLDVFEYNPRAQRSYEKAGFKVEGRQRQAMQRDGRRWDFIFMGILREEWLNDNGQLTMSNEQ
jgi:RimJ/RimL family protein N-acetyltransferase